MRRPLVTREAGTGRPTKKERRDMEGFRDGEPEEPDLDWDDEEEESQN